MPSLPPSRRRSLLRDLSDCLLQQMFLWGCDVRHPGGNLLVGFGMERLARVAVTSEGSSRYRMPWEGGVIELHGFCAGWYPARESENGIVFIRHRGKVSFCGGAEPVTPGEYASVRGGESDALLENALPLARWLVGYEDWIARIAGPAYRLACWRDYLALMGARPWLPPNEAFAWLRQLATSPDATPRARALAKGRDPHRAPSWKPRAFQS